MRKILVVFVLGLCGYVLGGSSGCDSTNDNHACADICDPCQTTSQCCPGLTCLQYDIPRCGTLQIPCP